MDLPLKIFVNTTLKRSAVISLRRRLKNNPFPTYIRWKYSPRKNKPKTITFDNARKSPEIIKDYFGNRFVVLSAIETDEGLVLPMGIPEKLYLDKEEKDSKKYILTEELAQILKDNRFYPHKIEHLFPFTVQTLAALRSELGYSSYADRNAWLAQHIEEILSSTAKGFCLKHKEIRIKKNVIAALKTNTKHIFTAMENNPALIKMLLENWEKPSETKRKELDDLLTTSRSKNTRRAFSILKEAKVI